MTADPVRPATWAVREDEDRDLEAKIESLIEAAILARDGGPEVVVGAARDEVRDHDVLVEVITETGGWNGELRVTVSGQHQFKLAADIMRCLRSVPEPLWKISPTDSGCEIHVQLTLRQLTRGKSINENPDRPAHIVLETALLDSLVAGSVVRSLCGYVFTPTESGSEARSRDVCRRCLQVRALIRRVKPPDETQP